MNLSDLSPFLVFLGIAAIGFLFLLITLVFGELFDHLGVDHDVDTAVPACLSGRIISVFVTAFGGFGAISTHYGLSPIPASLRRRRKRVRVRRRDLLVRAVPLRPAGIF